MRKTKETKENGGITLIALVITIIVLLILAGVSIATLTGQNGVLSQAGNAKTETAHSRIYEAMRLEAQSYLAEKNSGGYDGALIEYLNRNADKPIVNDEGVINIANLLGTTTNLGNGTSISSGDVYVLEQSDDAQYKIVYYGKQETENKELGSLIKDEFSTDADDVLEYGYLFSWTDKGELSVKYSDYSYYVYPISYTNNSTAIYLLSKNKLQLKNVSLVIPSRLKGKKVTALFGNSFSHVKGLEKVKIPDTVTTINARTFLYVSDLQEVQIPVSVTTIGDSAFYGCNSLKTIYYEGTEEEWKKINIVGYTDRYGNKPLSDANIIYNYKGNDIVEGSVETTKKTYEDYARDILNTSTEEEINELFLEGEKYWRSSIYNYRYPGQEITKELVAKDNDYSSYEELLQNVYTKKGYASLNEMLIAEKYVKPEEYFGK